MYHQIVQIASIEHLNKSYFVINIDLGKAAGEILPGQFFELKRPEFSYPMLRKPVSVYNIQDSIVSFMIKRIGKGTEQLAQMKAGDNLDIMGPLGNGFPMPVGDNIILISGGIGYPPLFYLKIQLENIEKQVRWLHGGRTKTDIFPADELWTDDGSAFNKGFVIDGLTAYLKQDKTDVIYACGPRQMLKSCHIIAEKYGIPLYVSLEEYMACGIGACHGCAVKIRNDSDIGVTYKTVCKDGPVFDSREVVWD